MTGNKEADRALALFDDARELRAQHDLRSAVAKLKESVALFPNEASLAMLGDDLLGEGRYAEAIVYLAAALGLGESTELRLSIAKAFEKIGSRSDALQQLRSVLERDAQHPAAREQLKALLRDPNVIAETARRHRILDALHQAAPEISFGREDWPVDALKQVGGWVLLAASTPGLIAHAHVVRLFEFFNQLAIHADPEVADLLTAAVFPELAEWAVGVELARSLLVGRARRAFDDAVALWGPPRDGRPHLTMSTLPSFLALTVPGSKFTSVNAGVDVARLIIDAVDRGPERAAAPEVALALSALSRMSESRDVEVLTAFSRGIREIVESRAPAVIERARRSLTGPALTAFERELDSKG